MPKMADIHFGLGCSLLALNHMAEAESAFRRALALSPDGRMLVSASVGVESATNPLS